MVNLFSLCVFIVLLLGNLSVFAQSTSFMSFNIRFDNPRDNENAWDNRKEEVVGLISYYHPDFLGIQEGVLSQVEFIRANTITYAYIGVGRDDGKRKGEFCALYYDSTKFELVDQKTFWLSSTPEKVSVGWDASMERICTYGTFKDIVTEDSIHIFNTHFDHIGEEARRNSAQLILAKIEEYGLSEAKIVVMGDFNAIPTSDPMSTMMRALDYGFDVSLKPFYGPLGTFNGFNPTAKVDYRIDHIFTKNLSVLSYRHVDDKRKNNLCVSDHFPVLVELGIGN